LNQKLQKEGVGIPAKDKNSPEAIKVYLKVLRRIKRKDIPRISQYNFGFQKFVEQMDSIKDEIAETE
jgi:soluble cytochrome b562